MPTSIPSEDRSGKSLDIQSKKALSNEEMQQLVGVLFERYEQKLLNFILARTRNPQDAEDICQDVFLRIVKQEISRDLATDEARLLSHIFWLTRWVIIDWQRKNSRRREKLKEFETQLLSTGEETDRPNDWSFMEGEEMDEVISCLSGLSEKEREVIVLRFTPPYPTYLQISHHLGVSITSVHNRIKRGIAKIRRILRSE